MDPKALARTLGYGRLGFGVAMLAAPRLSTRGWIGAEADGVGTQTVTRAFGAREVLLGFLAAHVASRPGVGKRTVAALAACDLVDLVATVAARRSLPATGVAAVGLVAGSGAVAGLLAAQGLD